MSRPSVRFQTPLCQYSAAPSSGASRAGTPSARQSAANRTRFASGEACRSVSAASGDGLSTDGAIVSMSHAQSAAGSLRNAALRFSENM